MQRAIDALRRFIPEGAALSAERITASGIPFYSTRPVEDLRDSLHHFLEAIALDLERGAATAYPARLAAIAAERAEQGVPAMHLLEAMYIAHGVVRGHFREVFAGDLDTQLWWERERTVLDQAATLAFVGSYMAAHEAKVRAQSVQIEEISAPVVPLHGGVVLLPLVGAVDAGRAERIMASLLESIDRHGARVVLLDVTGVPFLDAAVAGYLVRAVQASRLMGAEVALVGINARIARSVVDLGLDLQGIPVLADVQSGLEHALRVQGLAILKAR